MELTKNQIEELKVLKNCCPFRIIYGMTDKDTNQFSCYAVQSMRIPNKLSREGHNVFVAK